MSSDPVSLPVTCEVDCVFVAYRGVVRRSAIVRFAALRASAAGWVTVAASPPFEIPGGTVRRVGLRPGDSVGSVEHSLPAETRELAEAILAALAGKLVRAGWEPRETGGAWYHLRFRRVG